ncbi:PAAR domain-containing protein [Burkholderia sp. Ac-20344]|uniref:PAAR domain-containing protein n=1 Tax=Burkholderia sp. Ac-20344 TaxID=2703890 RepID=UPI00197B4FF4|nr:PAAR domain-containing protein [Burkholderia sp. Ac-20344]MBN3830782.1 PAAR domain-containing protein [Burkholderia sp. Ac-20344]
MTRKMLALKGNRTTTGGYVLDGNDSDLEDGVPYAYHMARASCGNCGQGGSVLGTAHTWGIGNTHGVLDGDIVLCACPRGTNRVIARSTLYYSE